MDRQQRALAERGLHRDADRRFVGGGHNGLVAAGLLAPKRAEARARARAARRGGRGRHHRAAVGCRLQGHDALVRREPDAPHGARPRATARAPRLQGLPADTATSRRTARRSVPDDAAAARAAKGAQVGKFSAKDAAAIDFQVGRLAGRARRAPRPAAPRASLRTSAPSAWAISSPISSASRVAAAGHDGGADGGRDAPDDDERRRFARQILVPIAAGPRRALGERRHRHVGGTAVARHGVRDGAPTRLGGAKGRWGRGGFPRGGMGGVRRGDAQLARGRSARRSARGCVWSSGSDGRGPGHPGVVLARGEEIGAARSSGRRTRGDVPEDHRADELPRVRHGHQSAGRRAAAP